MLQLPLTLDQLLHVFLLAATVVVVFSRSIIMSLLGLSVFSMFLALNYFVLNAPDVAITEAALGTGLTTIVFLVAIRKTSKENDQ
ncbi:MAG: DUF4040 domain-containing protein [Spirochaetaceae bacterium]|nr:MAG: DUF4040 domain-containing protein [Spirochaetaceae bacterium]